jgi:hypothetical protein
VKFLRLLAKFLLLAVALAALLALVSIAPVLQTWVAQMVLNRPSGLHGSLGALSARFGKVQIADLHLEYDGAVFTIPYFEARLPLTPAVLNRAVKIRSLVAKGWTLDLSHSPDRAEASAQVDAAPEGGAGAGGVPQAAVAPAQLWLHAFREILRGAKFPYDLSLDAVDLEGDVLVASPPGNPPAKVHVIVKGAGVAAGREGDWAIDARGEFRETKFGTVELATHGRLAVTMDSPRTLQRVELKGDLSAEGRSLPPDLAWLIDVAAARGAGEETYTLDLSRDNRRLATVRMRVPATTGRLTGTWKIDVRDSDLAPFVPDRRLPAVSASGEGEFDADMALARVHAPGRLNIVAGRLGALASPLDFLGTVTMDTRFDLVHSGQTIRVERLNVAVAGPGRTAVVQSLQPFECDERTGHLIVADSRNDWLEVSVGAFPLTGLPGLPGGITFVGGQAKGAFIVRVTDGGWAFRSKIPVVASDVAVQHGGKMVGRGLDLSLSFLADRTSGGWQLESKPLTIGSAGQRWATIEAKTTWPAKADQPTKITGTWNADLVALAAQSAIPGTGWITARSASGEFSASVGAWTNLEGKLVAVGPEADQTVSASFQANIGADLSVGFHVPVKITLGSSGSEVSADGTWAREKAGDRIEVRLTSTNVALEHLQQLAAPLAALGGSPLIAGAAAGNGGWPKSAGGKDQIPFWGDWNGSVTVGFDRLRAGDRDFNDARGIFDLDHGSLRLRDGLWELPDHSLAKAEGSISFDPAAAIPYGLKATAELGEVDAAPLFGDPPAGHDPVFKGRFSVATTLTGNGINLDDLAGRMNHEYRLAGKNGIIRLLKTSVAETIPQPAAPVSDAMDSAGAVVGSIFGIKRNEIKSRENHVSKNTEAVIDFTYLIAEIGYDQITITANQGPDQTIHLREIAMTGREVRATGSGQIAYVKGWSFPVEPLSVDLQLSVSGKLTGLLATAGLLSDRKDEKGYTLLNQTVHIGGTMQHLDESQWHDLLARAAAPKPDAKEKNDVAAAITK